MKLALFLKSIYAITLFSVITSCIKADVTNEEEEQNNATLCNKIKNAKIKPFTAVTKGEDIVILVDTVPDANYSWYGPGFSNGTTQNIEIYDAKYENRGWYKVKVYSYDCTESKQDSVYVNVKFPQGTPPCTLTNNTATFNNLGGQTFSYSSFGNSLGAYEIIANGSNGDLRIQMASAYWTNHELEDGIYYTTTYGTLGYDSDFDKIHISDVNSSIRWTAAPDHKVYVSHVNGKIRISFCDIPFTGSLGGPSYTTKISAQVTQR
jgi:hypothetical protein